MEKRMAEMLTIDVSCCLCSKGTKHTYQMPEGWRHRYEAVDVEQDGFCPDHAAVADFAEDQCAGCVGGWGDCPMWRAFAFSGRRRDITERDYASLRQGRCPRRVNGTFGVDAGGVAEIDLSSQAVAGGVAFADAIAAYIARYP